MKLFFRPRSYLLAALTLSSSFSQISHASRMDGAIDAAFSGEQYLDVSIVPMYQSALRSDNDTGNYTFDVIGKFTLIDRPSDTVGNTDLIMWVNSSDRIAGLDSASEMSTKSGLLWDSNDIGSDQSSTSLLVLALDQWLFNDTVSIGMGKYFPGQAFASSPYTSDNSNSFTSKMISSNPVVSWWEALGIGTNVGYWGDNWFVHAGFVDTQAEGDLDFRSFSEMNYAYMLETTYTPQRASGETSIGTIIYTVDANDNSEYESGLVAHFSHEWAQNEAWAVFGRYSWRDGGEAQEGAIASSEPVVQNGGFVGIAWNQPFTQTTQQLAVSLIYGEASNYKKAMGFNEEYGTEIMWRFKPKRWFTVIPNVQLMKNIDNEVETIVGLRLGFGFERNWPESSIIQ